MPLPKPLPTRARLVAAALGLAACQAASANILVESFENFAALSGAGWVFTNQSATPAQNWVAGNSGVFPAQAGTAGSYVAANFLSTNSLNGAISNWLITPSVQLSGGETLRFWARSDGPLPDFVDGLTVRLNPLGSTATGAFSTVLFSTTSVPTAWTQYTLTIPSLPALSSVRIAFEYTSPDALTASYLGLDSVSLVPEPGTAGLLAVGAAALLLRRRSLR